jgi:hypothetical protein
MNIAVFGGSSPILEVINELTILLNHTFGHTENRTLESLFIHVIVSVVRKSLRKLGILHHSGKTESRDLNLTEQVVPLHFF